MKLIIDMNLSPRWVDFFTASNIEAVHWPAIGAADAADSEIMAYAASGGFTVFTHDLDFGAILALRACLKSGILAL
jgi:predicted nuclease of predicted toxin-antitoxin system